MFNQRIIEDHETPTSLKMEGITFVCLLPRSGAYIGVNKPVLVEMHTVSYEYALFYASLLFVSVLAYIFKVIHVVVAYL